MVSSFYDRQILMDNFGKKGQDALSSAQVLIVGLGGLGCAAAQQLVEMGVGKLTLIDGDRVSDSNLSRQVLFNPRDVGEFKVVAGKRALNALRPECEINCISKYIHAALCEEIFLQASVVIDATDNFDAKFLINSAGVKFSVPIVWANAQKWEGQIASFDARKGSCYRCFMPSTPRSKGGDCNEGGVLGVVPNIIGCMQALECVKILCEIAGVAAAPKPVWGQLQSFSFRDATYFKTNIEKKSGCSVCGIHADEVVLPEVKAPTCHFSRTYPVFSLLELKKNVPVCLVDLREREEIREMPVSGAMSFPLSELEASVEVAAKQLNSSNFYAFFCKSGKRSRKAFDILFDAQLSVNNIFILEENASDLSVYNRKED